MTTAAMGLILLAALIAVASPGPATLALTGTAMSQGRRPALWLALGITCGSFMWSIAAAFGLSALMFANAWVFQIMRYFGAAYLLWLAYKSARSAFQKGDITPITVDAPAGKAMVLKGLALHLTNPKAILFFGALYAIGVPPGSGPATLALVIAAVGLQSAVVFHGFAYVFSSAPMARLYLKARRGLNAIFALGFGAAAVKIFTTRVEAL